MRITSIEEITWKTITPEPGAFPCFCCHGVNGNATHFVNAEMVEGLHDHKLRLPVCAKCAEYARIYPTWLEEILFQNRLKAAGEIKTENSPKPDLALTMPESVLAMDAGF